MKNSVKTVDQMTSWASDQRKPAFLAKMVLNGSCSQLVTRILLRTFSERKTLLKDKTKGRFRAHD